MYKWILPALPVMFGLATAPAHAEGRGTTVLHVGLLNGTTLDSSTPLHTDLKPGLGALIGIPESFDSPGTSATVSNTTTLQVAMSYFVTDHLAIKSEGGIPPKFYLRGKGVVQPSAALSSLSVDLGSKENNPIASSRQWSPALLLQYYFGKPTARWRPIVGVGVTYTFFTQVTLNQDFKNDLKDTFGRSLALANLNFPIDDTKVKAKSSPDWAPIANVGLNYAYDQHWGVALSVSYVDLKTTSSINIYSADGTRLSHSTTKIDIDPLATALLVSYSF
ncbi:OmpW/AlkL family protein [Solimonas marina]|uniref:OmpW family protein n=1 Tax=Solimonas marina TaxID=2714601 RepID=A0A969WH42_9GAMM|nr:OmpW family outer membrane protein [Solimonas marina]NKF24570.1 OmpW family protein [Solimonas marina]